MHFGGYFHDTEEKNAPLDKACLLFHLYTTPFRSETFFSTTAIISTITS